MIRDGQTQLSMHLTYSLEAAEVGALNMNGVPVMSQLRVSDRYARLDSLDLVRQGKGTA